MDRSIEFYVEKLGFEASGGERIFVEEVGFEVSAENRLPPGTVRISQVEDGSGAFLLFNDGEARWGLGLYEVEEVTHRHVREHHIAFRVAEEDVERMVPWLRERGIEPSYPSTAPVTGTMDEPIVHGWMPAAAAFFEDPDGNLLELIADLSDPPRPDFIMGPLSEWRAMEEWEE